MKLQHTILIIAFCLSLLHTQAQDTLFVYTKNDCSVCKQTKQALTAREISFVEKTVETSAFATEMLNKLAVSKFKGNIYLPVIYYGKKLMHPAYSTDSGLVFVEINSVVDSIICKYRRSEIANIKMPLSSESSINPTSSSSADCEHNTGSVYLIVANYPTEKEAINAVQILIKNSYSNAGFVHHSGIFRVYLALYPDFQTASSQLNIEKFKFTDAYLFAQKINP